MADLKISELTSLAGSSLANTDVLAVVDTSASETKKITSKELVQYGYGLVDPSTLDGNVIEPGTTSARGTVQLTDSTGSTSTTTAATPNAVKSAYDLANAALPKAGGTMTGQILGDDSTSASTPGYAFDGDPNTGIYSPGPDQVAISTAGTGRVFVSADGNLLVGGTSNAAGSRVLAENASGDQIGIRRTGIATYYLNVTNGGDLAINKDGPERLRITSDGKVGIGTQSPQAALHVNGAELRVETSADSAGFIRFINTSGSMSVGMSGAPANTLLIYDRTNNHIAYSYEGGASGSHSWHTNNVERLRITSTGALNFTGAGTPGVTQAVSFNGSAPVNSLVIDSTGKVGIGTSSPSDKLHVAGGGIFSTTTTAANLIQVRNSDLSSSGYFGVEGPTGGATVTGSLANATLISSGATGTPLQFGTAGVIRATLTSDGKVGIGTTSPAVSLDVQGSVRVRDGAGFEWNGTSAATDTKIWDAYADNTTGNTLRFRCLNDAFSSSNTWLQVNRTGAEPTAIILSTGTSEKARIDSSGRLLVGTSSARGTFFNGTSDAQFQVEGGGNTAFTRNSNDGFGSALILAKTRGSGNVIVQNNDEIGYLSFQGNDGTDFPVAASISAAVDGAPGADDMPGRLVFSTTPDNQSPFTGPVERMRIDNTGFTNIYGSATVFAVRSGAAAGTSQSLYGGYHSATSTSNGTVSYAVWTNGNVVNTNNSYGAISDIKLKENIVDAGSQWSDIKALQVRKYNFKEGQTHTQIGLVAQEVELVSPGLVSESPDRDEDGKDLGTVTKSVNYSVLYMKAVKALQEAMERIEQLESEMAAVKAQLP